MGAAEDQLKALAGANNDWDIPALASLQASAGVLVDMMTTVMESTSWTGGAADAANEAFVNLRLNFTKVEAAAGEMIKVISRANESRARAVAAVAGLSSTTIDPAIVATARTASVVIFRGTTLPADTAINFIQGILGDQREEEAKRAVDKLEVELDAEASSLNAVSSELSKYKPAIGDGKTKTDTGIPPVPPYVPQSPSYPSSPAHPSGDAPQSWAVESPASALQPLPSTSPTGSLQPLPSTFPTTPVGHTLPGTVSVDSGDLVGMLPTGNPGSPGGSTHFPGGDSNFPGGHGGTGPGSNSASTGGVGGPGAGLMGGGGAGAAAIAAKLRLGGGAGGSSVRGGISGLNGTNGAAARLGAGGLGGADGVGAGGSGRAGGGSGLASGGTTTGAAGANGTAGGAGGRGGLLGSQGGASASAGGNGSNVTSTTSGGAGGRGGSGMMGGGGAGDDEKDKRVGLGGLMAPKLDDESDAAPRSAGASAGGRSEQPQD